VVEIEFSNAAETDLVAIDAYSAEQFGEEVAYHYMHGFDQAFAQLRDFPQTGRPMPELGNEIRCLVHRRHRIFYTFVDRHVFIVCIVHYAMDAGRVLTGGGGVIR
jgi:plasmid stabilization system protein ParE